MTSWRWTWGALPSLDIFQSQSQVAQRKVGVIQAQYAYRDALDGLRRIIGADLESRHAQYRNRAGGRDPVSIPTPVLARG